MVSIITIFPFNKKKNWQKSMFSILAISWPAEKEVVSHTVRAWNKGRIFDLDGTQGPLQRDKWLGCCGVILSHRTTKIPSILNKPVPRGSKIVGETEREKKGRSSNHDWLVIIFYCISYMNYHFHVCFFSVRKEACSSVSVCCCGFLCAFFFSPCDPVSSCRTHRDKIFATV